MVFSVFFARGLSAQSSQDDIRARMQASVQRQSQSVAAMKTAIAAQVQSTARKGEQSPGGGFFLLAPPAAGPHDAVVPQCEALPVQEVDELVTRAGAASSVSPDLLRSVMKEESGFRPCALSEKGAMGLMQLMNATAIDLGVRDAFDPQENVTAGARYLKQFINLYNGDLALALSAYNAGPGRVKPSAGIPQIPETMNYVNKILSTLPVPDVQRVPEKALEISPRAISIDGWR